MSHYTEAGPGEPGTVLTVDFELDGKPARFSVEGGRVYFSADKDSVPPELLIELLKLT